VICELGGRLANKSGTKFGFQSRSLKAAYYLRRLGYKVSYVQGGIAQWANEQLPFEEGADDEEGGYEEEEPSGGRGGGLLGGVKLPALSLPRRR